MADLKIITELAQEFADERARLAAHVDDLQEKIDRLKSRALPTVRAAVQRTAEARDKLHTAIAAAPELFKSPRTMLIAGIRIGYTKQKGKVEIDDEAATIARIRKLLPEEQAVLLITVRERVHKPGVADLTATDLKRLGIRVTGDTDAVVIRPTSSDIDKLVNALLAESERIDPGAAA